MATNQNHQQNQPIQKVNTPPTRELALPSAGAQVVAWGMTRDQLELVKRTIAKGTTDDEFALFMTTANRMGLDPFARQIYAVKRWDNKDKREVMAIQVGIDGFRAVAARSGNDDGQEGPFWCGEDGVWRDVWPHSEPPVAAKVLVYKKGSSRPYTGIATYRSYVQTTREGEPNSMWKRGADFMLAKCAEAVALRKAHPAELGGVVAPEEVDEEADHAAATMTKLPEVAVVNAPPSAAKQANTAPPAAPPKVDLPAMSADDATEVLDLIRKAKTKADINDVIKARIAPRSMEQSIRDMLSKACGEQRALIDEAAKADKAAAEGTTTEGGTS